jgi:hypothetical protein
MPRIQATAFGKSLGLALSTSTPAMQLLPAPNSPPPPPPAFVFFPTATPMPIPEALQKALSPELRNSRSDHVVQSLFFPFQSFLAVDISN